MSMRKKILLGLAVGLLATAYTTPTMAASLAEKMAAAKALKQQQSAGLFAQPKPETAPVLPRSSAGSEAESLRQLPPLALEAIQATVKQPQVQKALQAGTFTQQDLVTIFMREANPRIEQLKQDYAQSIQEKDETIQQLRERIEALGRDIEARDKAIAEVSQMTDEQVEGVGEAMVLSMFKEALAQAGTRAGGGNALNGAEHDEKSARAHLQQDERALDVLLQQEEGLASQITQADAAVKLLQPQDGEAQDDFEDRIGNEAKIGIKGAAANKAATAAIEAIPGKLAAAQQALQELIGRQEALRSQMQAARAKITQAQETEQRTAKKEEGELQRHTAHAKETLSESLAQGGHHSSSDSEREEHTVPKNTGKNSFLGGRGHEEQQAHSFSEDQSRVGRSFNPHQSGSSFRAKSTGRGDNQSADTGGARGGSAFGSHFQPSRGSADASAARLHNSDQRHDSANDSQEETSRTHGKLTESAVMAMSPQELQQLAAQNHITAAKRTEAPGAFKSRVIGALKEAGTISY